MIEVLKVFTFKELILAFSARIFPLIVRRFPVPPLIVLTMIELKVPCSEFIIEVLILFTFKELILAFSARIFP